MDIYKQGSKVVCENQESHWPWICASFYFVLQKWESFSLLVFWWIKNDWRDSVTSFALWTNCYKLLWWRLGKNLRHLNYMERIDSFLEVHAYRVHWKRFLIKNYPGLLTRLLIIDHGNIALQLEIIQFLYHAWIIVQVPNQYLVINVAINGVVKLIF